MDFNVTENKLRKLHNVYAKLDQKVKYEKDDDILSENELRDVEIKIGCSIPSSLRSVFLNFSKKIIFSAYLPEDFGLDDKLKEIFSADFSISIEELVEAEMSRRSWVEGCFSNPEDLYDKVWHDKLGFMTVANGDIIAFDLNDTKEDKKVVYLSHDDGREHGYILGESFEEYFTNLLLIGACGNEGWQMSPFISDSISGLNPNCDNARKYRKMIGLYW